MNVRHLRHFIGTLAAAAFLTASTAEARDKPRPNVLFISFDDLGDWIRPLDPSSPIAMPNLERLARRGVTFRSAYCAAPECNPSRVALLSGLRPTTSGVYSNNADWKKALPDAVMLPRYFRNHGYVSVGAGKIFHHVDPYFHDDASFDRYLPFQTDRLPPTKRNGLTKARTPSGESEPLAGTFDWGASPTAEDEMLDTRSAAFAVDFLNRENTRPFFLAVGFFRPHLPYFSPARFLGRYPPEKMALPIVKENDLDDVASGARPLQHRWTRMFRGIQQAPDFMAKWREAVAAYAAGATYADEQLGRILDALEKSPHRENTIVVLWSDHGYHLGEKDHWTKFVLWEKSTRVPLIVSGPGVRTPGTVCDRPVSLVDIYPTLLELCGLPTRTGLDGQSFAPLLGKPSASRERPAIMTEMKGNHAVRSERWRYIRYADGTEELYDHQNDPHEWTNVAGVRNQAVMKDLRQWIPRDEREPVAEFVP